MKENSNHIGVLDGLRGFAVLYVMVDHLFPYTSLSNNSIFRKSIFMLLSMGWSGVDLFFVLSGFLITGILIRSRKSSTYFTAFYGRRVLRIFPLYYFLLILFILVVPRISFFQPFNYFWLTEGTTWQYWIFLTNMGGFSNMASHAFLSVSWSLAIEEQYYLLWPSIVKWLSVKKVLNLCVAGLVLSFILRIVLYFYFSQTPSSLYHLSFTHLDGILLGSLLSILYSNKDRHRRFLFWYAKLIPVLGFCCLIITIWSAFYPSDSSHICYQLPMVFLGYTFLPLFYGSLLIGCLMKKNFIYTLFNLSFLRKCGKYSYCMYLTHFIVAWFFGFALHKAVAYFSIDIHLNSYRLVVFPITILLTYLLSYISWQVWEGPFNRLKRYFPYRKINYSKEIAELAK